MPWKFTKHGEVSGTAGDGRYLFQSVAYGACLRRGQQLPSESVQKEAVDKIRAKLTEVLMILSIEIVNVPCRSYTFTALAFSHLPISVNLTG